MFKIIIKKRNSQSDFKIEDCAIVETRQEAEDFIRNCKALPIQYELDNTAPDCVYEMNHR